MILFAILGALSAMAEIHKASKKAREDAAEEARIDAEIRRQEEEEEASA
jgi:hypothetical protein